MEEQEEEEEKKGTNIPRETDFSLFIYLREESIG